ncbi:MULTISPECIES: hypothetical protein [unclassified Streptomyces]|nr:hypothetical protein [Streptomyces sp. SHP 1-2]
MSAAPRSGLLVVTVLDETSESCVSVSYGPPLFGRLGRRSPS